MWQPNDENMTPKAPTGGVAPLRHDLARTLYMEKFRARHAAGKRIRISPLLAGVSTYLAGIARWFTYFPVRRQVSAIPETA